MSYAQYDAERGVELAPTSADTPARAAQTILERYWNQKLPVDPVAIAHAAGIQVFANPSLGTIAGSYAFVEDEGPVIEYNPNEPALRQRFTIAHELGHFALSHGARFRDSTESFSLANYNPVEADANKFAAELLMPAAVVNGLISRHGIVDYVQLADLFKTSTVAMKYRLKNLGWL